MIVFSSVDFDYLSSWQTLGVGFFETWNLNLHPGRLTWNLKITQLKRKIIFQTIIFRFHVNLPGCSRAVTCFSFNDRWFHRMMNRWFGGGARWWFWDSNSGRKPDSNPNPKINHFRGIRSNRNPTHRARHNWKLRSYQLRPPRMLCGLGTRPKVFGVSEP